MPKHSIFPGIPTSGPRGHDLTGKEAAQGTCHKCGGSLSRGNAGLAKQSGACGTRFQMSDCGGRLAAAGYHDVFDQCPKVRRPESRLFTRERADDAPPNPRAPFPPHMDLESCVYAVSGFFVLGDRTRRGCCARSIIPGAVRSARGVDRVARSLDRASPAGFHAQPHRPTGRVLTHSPRAKRLTHVSRSFHIESGVWRLPMRVRFLFELCRTRGSRENFMDSQKLTRSFQPHPLVTPNAVRLPVQLRGGRIGAVPRVPRPQDAHQGSWAAVRGGGGVRVDVRRGHQPI